MMITPKLWCIFSSAENKRSKIKSILILSLLFFQAATAQETIPSLKTEFTQKNQSGPQYQVGDRIQLNIRIPLELSQSLSSIQLKNSDEKNPLDKLGWYLDNSPQVINGNLRFIASPLKSGKLILPELYIVSQDNHLLAKTSPIEVDVASLTPNPSATPALLDTIPISLPIKFVIITLIILGILLLIARFIYKKYFSKKTVAKAIEEIRVPPTPDHVIALRELNLLYDQHSFSKENLKPIAFGVSQILKNFFSARFKVDAKESTTDEMLVLLAQESLPEQDLKKIKQLFVNLDLIKFTKLSHHEHFQKADYLEFKEHARTLIEAWVFKGDSK